MEELDGDINIVTIVYHKLSSDREKESIQSGNN